MSKSKEVIGVIGAGSFGMAVSRLLSLNREVILYSRNEETIRHINEEHVLRGVSFNNKVMATNDIEMISSRCKLIFPVVPSPNFRKMITEFSPYLTPSHILIHGTKGFDTTFIDDKLDQLDKIKRDDIHTMSEVIVEETSVVRIGCLSGPNLATEIIAGQPTATVIGSRFKEVIQLGQAALQSKSFHVFGTYEVLGCELAGALKNIVAIGSGILAGKGLGRNIQAMLINRGLTEMIHLGKAMGADSSKPFLGTAGIADLVATATSSSSRNFTVGYLIGKGEPLQSILDSMPEYPEGVRTLKIANKLSKNYKLHTPIIYMLNKVVFDHFDLERAITFLMEYPYTVDVDFI